MNSRLSISLVFLASTLLTACREESMEQFSKDLSADEKKVVEAIDAGDFEEARRVYDGMGEKIYSKSLTLGHKDICYNPTIYQVTCKPQNISPKNNDDVSFERTYWRFVDLGDELPSKPDQVRGNGLLPPSE